MTEKAAEEQRQHEHQKAYFDRAYGRIDGYQLENWRLSYIDRIFADLKVRGCGSGYRFLDVGIGGMGYTSVEAAREGAEAWGVDLSEVAVASARRVAGLALDAAQAARCQFVVGPAEALPFPDGHFDGVSCIAVLEHIVRDRDAMAELVRVTRPGGRIYITVPHSFSKTPWPLAVLNWVNDKLVGHLRHYSPQALAESLGPGCRALKTVYHGHLVKLWQFLLGFIDKSMAEPGSQRWWKMEKEDLDAWQDDRASMLSMVFEKRP
jgi:ubiquinone/menaquinone biosynthesis C-methylase UbiE